MSSLSPSSKRRGFTSENPAGTRHSTIGLANHSPSGLGVGLRGCHTAAVHRNISAYREEREALWHNRSHADLVDSKSTLAMSTYDHEQYLVYASGRRRDCISMQRARVFAGDGAKRVETFTTAVPLRAGEQILSIQALPLRMYGGSGAKLLAHTSSRLFLLHAVEGAGTGKESVQVQRDPPTMRFSPSLRIEREWNFEGEGDCLRGLSVGRGAAGDSGALLTSSGVLHSWSASQGPLAVHKPADNHVAAAAGVVEMSLHPRVCFISRGGCVDMVDFRTTNRQRGLHDLVTAELFSASGASTAIRSGFKVRSLCQHAIDAHHLFACVEGSSQRTHSVESDAVFLLDTRYLKRSVSRRFVPQAHHTLSGGCGGYSGLGEAAMVGFSPRDPLLSVHDLQCYDTSSKTIHTGTAHLGMLSATSAFGAAAAVRWETQGYPVVDGSSTHLTTCGAVLAACEVHSMDKGIRDKTLPDCADFSGEKATETRKRAHDVTTSTQAWPVLYHQNSIGDVYSQVLLPAEVFDRECYAHSYSEIFAEDEQRGRGALPSGAFLFCQDQQQQHQHIVASQSNELSPPSEPPFLDMTEIQKILTEKKFPVVCRLLTQTPTLWEVCDGLRKALAQDQERPRVVSVDPNAVRTCLLAVPRHGGLGLTELDVGSHTARAWRSLSDGCTVQTTQASVREESCSCSATESQERLCTSHTCVRIHQLVYSSPPAVVGKGSRGATGDVLDALDRLWE